MGLRGLGVLLLGLVACRSGPAKLPAGPLDAVQAERAVRDWISAWKPGMNRDMAMPVVDLSPPGLWQQLEIQVLQIRRDQPILGCTNFVVQDGELSPIGAGLGGHGVMSMAVVDLDQDGAQELAYSYSWGSGIHRTQFGLWRPQAPRGDRERVAATSFADGDVRLVVEEDGGVALFVAPYLPGQGWTAEGEFLGQLEWDAARDGLRVQLAPGLSPQNRSRIWTRQERE